MTGDPLPSWLQTPAKQAIVDFVAAVTDPDSAEFVPEPERIAVFDNDGTLWTEQPRYAQLAFALDRAAELGHPTSPGRAARGRGMPALTELLTLTARLSITTDEFGAACRRWAASASHPRFGRAYPELVYQPMLELLDLLDGHGFSCWIFSGGGTDFMRAFPAEIYGLPPYRGDRQRGGRDRVPGRRGRTPNSSRAPRSRSSTTTGRKSRLRSTPTSGSGQILAAGNTDGDLAMLPVDRRPARTGLLQLVVRSTPTPSASTPTTVTPSWARRRPARWYGAATDHQASGPWSTWPPTGRWCIPRSPSHRHRSAPA